jgi:hypothetical protein
MPNVSDQIPRTQDVAKTTDSPERLSASVLLALLVIMFYFVDGFVPTVKANEGGAAKSPCLTSQRMPIADKAAASGLMSAESPWERKMTVPSGAIMSPPIKGRLIRVSNPIPSKNSAASFASCAFSGSLCWPFTITFKSPGSFAASFSFPQSSLEMRRGFWAASSLATRSLAVCKRVSASRSEASVKANLADLSASLAACRRLDSCRTSSVPMADSIPTAVAAIASHPIHH